MKQLAFVILALALFAAPIHASVTPSLTVAPSLGPMPLVSTATPAAPNRVTSDVATFTPTPSTPTATPTAALAGGPQELPKPTPWAVVARLFLPLIGMTP